MALPMVQPRLGDATPEPATTGNWDGTSRGINIKPQRQEFEFSHNCRFGFCQPAIAPGAFFLGAIGGLGQLKIGKSRGDVRLAGSPDPINPPSNIDTVIEAILSGGNVADVGKAFGAKGGHADRRGGAELLAAGRWAKLAVANDNRSKAVTNGATNSRARGAAQ